MAGERWQGVLSRQLVLSLYLPATVLAFGTSMVAPVIPNLTKEYQVGFAEASLVFIADAAAQNQRARQMQWMMGMTRAGQLIGPALGGFLAAGFGVWVPFVVHAILSVVVALPTMRLIKETRQKRAVS